jgi:glycosyltransferase involved in cell wall biosynthesis
MLDGNSRPFLTVITRHVQRRAELLKMNQMSLAGQDDPDYQQIVITDAEGLGVNWANGQMAERDWSDIKGEYVMVLDDDDILNEPEVITRLKETANYMVVDLMVMKMDHGERGVLPPDDLWGEHPQRGRIGCSAVVPSREVFLRAVQHYRAAYDGDFNYIEACFVYAQSTTWVGIVGSKVLQIGALTEV